MASKHGMLPLVRSNLTREDGYKLKYFRKEEIIKLIEKNEGTLSFDTIKELVENQLSDTNEKAVTIEEFMHQSQIGDQFEAMRT